LCALFLGFHGHVHHNILTLESSFQQAHAWRQGCLGLMKFSLCELKAGVLKSLVTCKPCRLKDTVWHTLVPGAIWFDICIICSLLLRYPNLH
jgi:hypothetical protein